MWFEPRMVYPSKIRVLHTSPDAPVVDVYVNDKLVIKDLPYKGYTNYMELMPGDNKIKLTPSGNPNVIALEKEVEIPMNSNLTVDAINRLQDLDLYSIKDWKVDNEIYQEYKENERDCGCKQPMQNDMNFSTSKEEVSYIKKPPCPIQSYINDHGYMQPIQNMNREENYGYVRFIHLSPNAPAVDITLPDGTLVFNDIQYKEVTDYIPLMPGNYTLQVRPFGTSQVVLTIPNIVVQQDTPSTIYAIGLVGTNPPLEAIQLTDDE